MSLADLPHSPAAERNRVPIGNVLERQLGSSGRLLEIGAGTGQHAVYLAARLPAWQWCPTDRAPTLPGLRARCEAEASDNVQAPLALDVLHDAWPEGPFDAAYSANTAHIMSWEGVCATFAGLERVLRVGGRYFLYGPFREHGRFDTPSNEAFDAGLRRQDPAMGLRDIEALESLAKRHQMEYQAAWEMPANNRLLVYLRSGAT